MGFNVDISKILPARPYSLLAAFLPGLFFEISIILSDPEFVGRILPTAKQSIPINGYALIGIILFLAFVIGNGFMLLISLIQKLIRTGFRLATFTWRKICAEPVRKLLHLLLTKPVGKWRIVILLHRAVILSVARPAEDWAKIWSLWLLLARRLLKSRYGINPESVSREDWGVLFPVLGRPVPEDMRGSLIMMANHATGWAGVLASRFAIALQNRYYLGFCALLIACGLIHDFNVAERTTSGFSNGYLAVRALLRELRQTSAAQVTGPSQTQSVEDSSEPE